VRVDWLGAGLLFGGISALLIALALRGTDALWAYVASAVLLATFVVVERRVSDPILPLDLLKSPLMARTVAVVFLVGTALFGAIAFIPLFVQAVMGATATEAGQVLTPLFMGWVVMSIVAARLTVRLGYRRLASGGSLLMTIGFIGLTTIGADSPRSAVLISSLLIGSGMGLSMLSLLLAVQHGVDRANLGIATSLNQFSRSVGAAVGVSAMGALMTRQLSGVAAGGVEAMVATGAMLTGAARLQFASALHSVFVAGAALAGMSVAATFLLPPVNFSRGVAGGASSTPVGTE
jgi:predicted MFS family arabinose efflux permease